MDSMKLRGLDNGTIRPGLQGAHLAKTVLRAVAALAVFALSSVPAQAVPIAFSASLSGPAESPPNASSGTGTALVIFDLAANTLSVDVTFSGLTGNTTASHIHCCTAVPLTGTAGVATTTPTFAGFPLGVTAGTYHNVLDLTLASSFNPAFVTMQGGSLPAAELALFNGMVASETYLNVHTNLFPGGEIRGFLVAVPEPGTLALFGSGLLGLAFARRKVRHA